MRPVSSPLCLANRYHYFHPCPVLIPLPLACDSDLISFLIDRNPTLDRSIQFNRCDATIVVCVTAILGRTNIVAIFTSSSIEAHWQRNGALAQQPKLNNDEPDNVPLITGTLNAFPPTRFSGMPACSPSY